MSVSSKIFNRKYYFNICFGSEEFKKSKGHRLNNRVKTLIDKININSSMKVLEIGCGRGDTALYVAKHAHSIVGIDYSRDAINIANKIKNTFPKTVKKRTEFHVMRANSLKFKDNEFDAVILIDTIDHLSKHEVEATMKGISRVLKQNGLFFIRTCSNRFFLNGAYKYYIYPLNKFITFIDKKIKNVKYDSLPKNPRTKEQKKQHINEPNYFYLSKLFKKFNFSGKINTEIGAQKEITGLRSRVYNFIVTLYPLSKYYPLNIMFASSFICELRNNKLNNLI